MTRQLARALTVLLICGAGLVGAGAGISAPPAHGDPTGGILVIPGEGSNLVAPRLRTSAGCPAQADAYYARMWGQGFPAEGQIVTSNTTAGISHSIGFDAYFGMIFKDFADLNGGATLGGRYALSVYCIDSFTQEVFAEFTGSLEFTTPTSYTALGAAKPTGPPPPPLSISGSGEGVDLNGPPGAGQPPAGQQPDGAAAAPGDSVAPSADGAAPDQAASESTAPVAQSAASEDNTANTANTDNTVLIVLIATLVGIALIWAVAYGIVRRRRSS